MEKVLYFLSNYNAQIIQAGFAVVFLLIIVYVYRAFFMAGSLSGDMADVAHSPAIEQKLNQILEIQRSKSGSSASASAASSKTAAGSGSALNQNAEEEIDKLKAEIYNLRQQLSDVAKSSVGSSSESSAVASATQALEAGMENDAVSSKATVEMVVKVKELESRLAEYEIIADDIAELSQLRADNAKLKEQLSKVQRLTPAAIGNLQLDAADALFASATTDSDGELVASEPVAAAEQELINEFEKITQKKDDE